MLRSLGGGARKTSWPTEPWKRATMSRMACFHSSGPSTAPLSTRMRGSYVFVMNTRSGFSSLIASTAASLRAVQFATTFGSELSISGSMNEQPNVP
jgi:hypothetical protein